MEFDLQLKCILVWSPAVVVYLRGDAILAPWQQHPCVPVVITWAMQRVVHVTLTGSHLGASLSQSLTGGTAYVRLLGVFRTLHISWHQSQKRALSAAVGLLWWQLYLYKIAFRHSFLF